MGQLLINHSGHLGDLFMGEQTIVAAQEIQNRVGVII
jgi:hypothetical protein